MHGYIGMIAKLNERMAMYQSLPSTSELLKALKLPKQRTAWDKRTRILTWIMVGAYLVLFMCWAFVQLDLVEKRPTALVALSSLGIATLAWVLAMLIDVIRTAPSIIDPAAEMARQFDLEVKIESKLLPLFRSVPSAVIAARHKRLEWQLMRWEKWLDTARLMGMLGPPLIFVSNGLIGKYIPQNSPLSIETFVSALLTGMLIGAVSLRTGMKRLQWVPYLLCRVVEERQKPPQRYKRKRAA